MCEGDAPRKHYADSPGVMESLGIMIIRTEIAEKGRSSRVSVRTFPALILMLRRRKQQMVKGREGKDSNVRKFHEAAIYKAVRMPRRVQSD